MKKIVSLQNICCILFGENKMNSFFNNDELKELGLGAYGNNVFISRKASIYGAENISIGNNVRIDDFCILSGKIKIADYVHVAAYSAVYGGQCGVIIDDYANISSRVSIYATCDDFSGETMTNPMVPDEYKCVNNRSVHIKRHVIIGATSVVLPGVVLEEGSAFGSFSLIKANSSPWSINVGIPAKKIADRSMNLLQYSKQLEETQKI